MSIISSLLFGLHPIHTEAINYIAARADIIQTIFALLSLLSYLNWRKMYFISSKPKKQQQQQDHQQEYNILKNKSSFF